MSAKLQQVTPQQSNRAHRNGRVCPECGGCAHVYMTRDSSFAGVAARRRRLKCDACDYRWATYELPAEALQRLTGA